MKMINKLLKVILCLGLLSIRTNMVHAEDLISATPADGSQLTDWDYTVNSDRIYLHQYVGDNAEIVIPGEFTGHEGKSVYLAPNETDSAIVSSFFKHPNGINKITIGSTDKKVYVEGGYGTSLFAGLHALTEIQFNGFDTSQATDMSLMFYECSELVDIDLSGFDTSQVTTMSFMFAFSTKLTDLDLSSFDTSQVTTMSAMFYNCKALINLNLSHFDTSQVTTMSSMFERCTELIDLDLSHFDTTKVTTMRSMFGSCISLKNLNLSGFNTSQVTDMDSMFYGCSKLTGIDVSSFDTSQVQLIGYMFYDCSELTGVDLSGFDTSQVTDMRYMFYNCSELDYLDLSGFDTSQVTTMSGMFKDCSGFSDLDLSGFDTLRVIEIYDMFKNCSKLRTLNLASFDFRNVRNFGDFVEGTTALTALLYNPDKVGNLSSSLSGFKVTDFSAVNFNANGGKFTDNTETKEQRISVAYKGDKPVSFKIPNESLADLYTPVKSGCSFTNWCIDKECKYVFDLNSSTTYQTDGSSTITLYAGYKVIPASNSSSVFRTYRLSINQNEYVTGSKLDLIITTNGPLKRLNRVQMDHEILSKTDYVLDVEKGTITLKAAYLDALDEGEHTFNLRFSTGSGTITLSVAKGIVKGWVSLESGNWEYFQEDGTRATRWVASYSDWYYVKEGVMLRNTWIAKDGQGDIWYYVGDDGAMLKDTMINGYKIDSRGIWSR